MDGFVWMRNPGTGGVQRFAAGAAEWWRDAGWEPCDPPAEPNPAIGPEHPSRTTPIPAATPAPAPKPTVRRTAATDQKKE